MEPNAMSIEVDLTAHQTVGPVGIDGKRASQKGHRHGIGGSAQVDDAAPARGLEIEVPSVRKRATRGGVGMCGGACPMRRNVRVGVPLQVRVIEEPESLPHLGLPATIEVLDQRLEARAHFGIRTKNQQPETNNHHQPPTTNRSPPVTAGAAPTARADRSRRAGHRRES